MKNKFTLIILLSVVLSTGYSQKTQTKSGSIIRDKESVAKLEGGATLLNGAHLIIKSLNDETLVTIEETLFNTRSYFQEGFFYYTLTFASLPQPIIRILDRRYTSEKKIIENLYKEIGQNFLTKDGLNKDMVTAFALDHNDHTKLQEDTTHIHSLVKQGREALKQPITQRDMSAGTTLQPFSGEFKWKGREPWRNKGRYDEVSTLAIYQGNVMIGVLIKILTGSGYTSAPGTPTTYTEGKYYLLRKVKPFAVQGDAVEYVTVASLKAGDAGIGTLENEYENYSRFGHKVRDFKNAEWDLINIFLLEGKL